MRISAGDDWYDDKNVVNFAVCLKKYQSLTTVYVVNISIILRQFKPFIKKGDKWLIETLNSHC